MSDRMTESEFAQQIVFLMRQCAGWAGDMLGPRDPDRLHQPLETSVLCRFLQDTRERLNRMEEWASGKGAAPGDDPEDRLYQHAVLGTRPDRKFARDLTERALGQWRDGERVPSRFIWNEAAVERLSANAARTLYRQIIAG